jgi:hypothetical protein
MAKVFLIEPHRVLQQAIVLSIFPEHDVQVVEQADPGAIAELNAVDLLIVDASALRDAGNLTEEASRALQNASMPIIWIDDGSAEPPKRDKLLVVKKPIESASLYSAVAEYLGPTGVPRERKPLAQKGKARNEPEPIELVEIVEEESSSEKRGFTEKTK